MGMDFVLNQLGENEGETENVCNEKARMVFFPELQVENVRSSIGIF
jgi:hypothetical protein